MRKQKFNTINIGGAGVIVIFTVLCLVIFGMLSFSAAFADKKLTDRTLENMARYYMADLEAEEKLAEIYAERENPGIIYYKTDYLISGVEFYFENQELKYKIIEWRIEPDIDFIYGEDIFDLF